MAGAARVCETREGGSLSRRRYSCAWRASAGGGTNSGVSRTLSTASSSSLSSDRGEGVTECWNTGSTVLVDASPLSLCREVGDAILILSFGIIDEFIAARRGFSVTLTEINLRFSLSRMPPQCPPRFKRQIFSQCLSESFPEMGGGGRQPPAAIMK
jgi:hypothetical protein